MDNQLQPPLRFQLIPCLLMSVFAAFYFAAYAPGPTPPPVKTTPPTIASMNREIAHDRLMRRYHTAEVVARRIYRENGCDSKWASPTARAAVDFNIPVSVLSALVFVESSCRPNIVSTKGAIGLAQINPRVWHYSPNELRDPEINLRAGASILVYYVHQSGLREGLHRYNGLGDASDDYSNRVLVIAGYQP